MDCTSNGSAKLKQDDGHNADDVQQQINKQGEDEQQQVNQMGIATMMVVNKGKRTKRQRLHNSDMSPIRSSSTNDHVVDEDDEEEQLDMAKCLILLAQGQSRPSSSYSHPPPASIPCDQSGQMSGSKRRRSYRSSSLSVGLSAGVYECKTCNKTFPSFQALGGHRASHKKLNATTTSYQDYFINPLSLQLGNINYSRAEAPPIPNSIPTTSAVVNAQTANTNNNKKSMNKIHECTICGAEFSSGQALGGHMRRHRGSVVPLNSSTKPTTSYTIAANTTLSLSSSGSATAAGKVVDRISNNNDNFLSLDLNMPLPASPSPEVDTKFSLRPKQQSGAMVFSKTPALVDCFH